MSRELIYFTLGNNHSYLKLAKLCIESLYRVGYSRDLLFITDARKEIEAMGLKHTFFLDTDKSDLLHSSAAKLRIYEYIDILRYDKIIYCDLDVLWLKSPDIIFERLVDDKIYVTEENNHIADRAHAGKLISSEESILMERSKRKGLNTGFFAFKSSMLPTIQKIYLYFLENKDKGGRCLEQPHINVYLWRNYHLYDTSLTSLVAHNGWHRKDAFDGVLIHFAGDIGRTPGKLTRIKSYINQHMRAL